MNDHSFKIQINQFPKGWKALCFEFDASTKPKGFTQWRHALWGWDIWYDSFPVMKSLILANILIWGIFIL